MVVGRRSPWVRLAFILILCTVPGYPVPYIPGTGYRPGNLLRVYIVYINIVVTRIGYFVYPVHTRVHLYTRCP